MLTNLKLLEKANHKLREDRYSQQKWVNPPFFRVKIECSSIFSKQVYSKSLVILLILCFCDLHDSLVSTCLLRGNNPP